MSIFKNRPLFTACALLTLTVFLTYYLPFALALVLLCVAAAGVLALVLWAVLRKLTYHKLALLLLSLAVLFATVRVMIDTHSTERVFASRMEETCDAELTVREVRHANAYGSELLVDVRTLNGARCRERAILRSDIALPFGVKDRILCTAQVMPLDFDNYTQNAAYTYLGEGAGAILVLQTEEEVVLLESGIDSLQEKLQSLRAVLAHRIRRACDGEAGELASAMLLGARDGLSDETLRDFRRAGVSHLLALSGLHLTLLVGMLDRLLYVCKAGKRTRIFTVIPLVLVYLFLTGCSFSMLRATVMLLFVYLAFLLHGDHDALTALGISAAAILLIEPTAVFNTSFQMTVLATLGLLTLGRLGTLFAGLFPPRGRSVRGALFWLLRWVLSSLCTGVAASVMILPVLWLTFGEISLLTPFANLVMIPLAWLFLLACLLVLISPTVIFARSTVFLGNAMTLVAGRFSLVNGVVSLTQDFVPYILIPAFVLLAVLLIVDLKKYWWTVAAVPILAAIAFAVCLSSLDTQTLTVTYRRTGNNEGLVLVQGDVAMICDSSNGSLTQLKRDWELARTSGATELEVLMLTHYHSKHRVALSRFLNSVRVRTLWLPAPLGEDEAALYAELCDIAKRCGVRPLCYAYDESLTVFGNGEMMLSEPLYTERSVQGAFALSIRYGEHALCYHTAAYSEYLRAHEKTHNCEGKVLILGAHGPVPHEEITLPPHAELHSVLVANEEILQLLALRKDAVYLPFPQKHIFYMN